MAAPPLVNTLEGGSNTTAISAANSGALSGNAFDAISTVAPTFSNTQVHGGAMAMAITSIITTGQQQWTQWNTLGSVTTSVYFRCYLWLAANPATICRILKVQTSAAAASAWLRVNTAGQLANLNAAATGAGAGTMALALGAWNRIEWRIVSSTTVGVMERRCFKGVNLEAPASTPTNGTTVEVQVDSAQVLGANSDQIVWGWPTAATSPAAAVSWYMDDLAVSTVDWLGPSAIPRTPVRQLQAVNRASTY